MKLATAISLFAVGALSVPGASRAAEPQSPPSASPVAAPKSPVTPSPAPTAPKTDTNDGAPVVRSVTPGFANAVTRGMDIGLPTPEQVAAKEIPAVLVRPPEANNAQIQRLDPVTVYGEIPLVFRERDLYSSDDLRRIALMRYRGLNVFPNIFLLGYLNQMNLRIADQLYRGDERVNNIKSLNASAAAAAMAGDTASADSIRYETKSTYRRSGPAWENPTRSSATPGWTSEVK